MLEYRDKIRNEYPIGSKVKAIIYELRHEGIYEPQVATIAGSISEEEIKQGYRFGLLVEYKEKLYWVNPEDVKIMEE